MTQIPKNLQAILQQFPSYDALREDYAAYGFVKEYYDEIIAKLHEYDVDIQRDLQRLVNRSRSQSSLSAELNQLDKSYSLKVFSRVKSLESVYHKLCLGEITWEDLPLEDILGYRVVCRFLDECKELRDIIDSEIQKPPFALCSRFPRDASGHWVHKVEGSGYRSCDFAFLYRRPELSLELEGELQLRTQLQHAWAEVSHDTFYKNDDVRHIPPSISGAATDMMHSLSDSLEAVDRNFVTLRKIMTASSREKKQGET